MLVSGSEIEYSCVAISEENYKNAVSNMQPYIYGFVVDGIYRPAEDLTLKCKNDWCLDILNSYSPAIWVVINRHPGQLYTPMCDITGRHYDVISYDIWQSKAGKVAVVNETDEHDI